MLQNYFKDPFGVIHQRCVSEFKKDYATQYNSYGELSNYMAYLRFGYVHGVTGGFGSVLDVGYGNGAFLKVCQQAGVRAYGYDISDYPVPEGCEKVDKIVSYEDFCYKYYDVITFFDSLEHFDDLNFVYDLQYQCKYIVISVPNCENWNDNSWFEAWKHRRPNEHLHHFNYSSLKAFMEYGNRWELKSSSYIEDVIRKGVEPRNILTMVFKRK